MEKTKKEKMEDVLIKMEDIRNSQISLLEKLGKVTVDLLDLPNKKLEESVEHLNSECSKINEYMKEAITVYEMEINSTEG